jgi:hypothetical protein
VYTSPTSYDSYYLPTPTVVTYPAYTSWVDGEPVTAYETVTAYSADNFDEEIIARPTLTLK